MGGIITIVNARRIDCLKKRRLYVRKYKCVNCGKEISPTRSYYCPYCNFEQPLEGRAEALDDEIVDIECPNCGFPKSFFRSNDYWDVAYCPRCGKTTYINKEGKKSLPVFETSPSVSCPYCNSTNTQKISTANKVGSALVFGIFSLGKVTKQWHCNNCKSDF